MPAMIYYPSAVSDIFPDVGTGGRCAAGGPIYHRTDFAASAPRPWPTYYEGKWLITDCSRGWVISVTLDKDSNYQSMERFLPSVRFAEPMDMKFGPEGDLYVLDYGSTWFAKSDDSKLVRIEYTAGNRTPKAVASADKAGGIAPVPITLSAAGSIDHDGDALRYEWRVQPDAGGATRTFRTANPRVSFDRNGTYIATLFVTDAAGAEDSASLEIVIGNEPPVVAVNVATANKTFYTPGAPIAYSVEASDKEDGKPAAGQVALGIDYVPEGFDTRDIVLGRTEVSPATRFAVARALMAKSDCLQCHVPTGARVRGPTMAELAAKYKPDNATLNTLVAKVRSGGTGVWGPEVMPAHPVMTPLEARTIVQYLLSSHETALAAVPLAGTYTLPTSDVDSGRGSVVINAAYTDKGAAALPWQTTQNITVLRSPRIDPSYADVKSGIDLTTGRNQSIGSDSEAEWLHRLHEDRSHRHQEARPHGAGRRPRWRRPWLDDRSASRIAHGRAARTTDLHASSRGAGRRTRRRRRRCSSCCSTTTGSGGTRQPRRPAVAVAGVAAAVRSPLRPHVVFRRQRDLRLKLRRRQSDVVVRQVAGVAAGAAGAAPPAAAPATTTAAQLHRRALIHRPDAGAGAAAAVEVAGAAAARGTPPLSIDLKPMTGTHDVYIVFKNDKAPASQRLMTVSLITFVQ